MFVMSPLFPPPRSFSLYSIARLTSYAHQFGIELGENPLKPRPPFLKEKGKISNSETGIEMNITAKSQNAQFLTARSSEVNLNGIDFLPVDRRRVFLNFGKILPSTIAVNFFSFVIFTVKVKSRGLTLRFIFSVLHNTQSR